MMTILVVLMLLGLIPAAIAQSKGHGFFAWWVYGALLFIVALPYALLMPPNLAALEARQLADGGYRKCPSCAEIIRRDAAVCRFCGRDVAGVQATPSPTLCR
jgi:hypothetical protein